MITRFPTYFKCKFCTMRRGWAAHDLDVRLEWNNRVIFHLQATAEVVRDVFGGITKFAVSVCSIGALYSNPELAPAILAVLKTVFGDVEDVTSGSLHFSLYCTDARFLKVLDDYESGKIKLRLEEEFLKVGIKTTELEVIIENMKEVEERKAAIKERSPYSAQVVIGGEDKAMDTDDNVNTIPAIIVQGGWFAMNVNPDVYRKVSERAASEGHNVLTNGGSAVDAAEKAIRVFEENDHFNAGRGSFLNASGEVECDAMIMDGHNMKIGAVISGRHFPYPVSIARKIMDESDHCALNGEGALEFALSLEDFDEICAPKDLKGDDCPYQKEHVRTKEFVPFTKQIYKGEPIQKPDNEGAVAGERVRSQDHPGHDTVSAVAIDGNGYLACANSSGGIPGKLKGRVSDASLVGCGAYANKVGAAATHGPGESIMKMTLAREVVYNMEKGQNAQEAAENAVLRMRSDVNASSGAIAIDRHGGFGIAFSTLTAVWASMKNNTLLSGMRLGEYEVFGPGTVQSLETK